VSLFGEVCFEGNRLLNMKLPEVAKFGVALEPMDRLRHAVERAFAEALRLLQEGEVSPLNPPRPLLPDFADGHLSAWVENPVESTMSIGRRPVATRLLTSEIFAGTTLSAPPAKNRRPALAPPNAVTVTLGWPAANASVNERTVSETQTIITDQLPNPGEKPLDRGKPHTSHVRT